MMLLNSTEVKELTGRMQRNSQAEALRQMGIEHKIRPDGRVAVLRAHVERELGLVDLSRIKKPLEPNWSAI